MRRRSRWAEWWWCRGKEGREEEWVVQKNEEKKKRKKKRDEKERREECGDERESMNSLQWCSHVLCFFLFHEMTLFSFNLCPEGSTLTLRRLVGHNQSKVKGSRLNFPTLALIFCFSIDSVAQCFQQGTYLLRYGTDFLW